MLLQIIFSSTIICGDDKLSPRDRIIPVVMGYFVVVDNRHGIITTGTLLAPARQLQLLNCTATTILYLSTMIPGLIVSQDINE